MGSARKEIFQDMIGHLMTGYEALIGDKVLSISDGVFVITSGGDCPTDGQEVLFKQCLSNPNSLNLIKTYLTGIGALDEPDFLEDEL